jgi:hypothetical protein
MGIMGLGTLLVNGRNRVPKPPAMITAFMGPSSLSRVLAIACAGSERRVRRLTTAL